MNWFEIIAIAFGLAMDAFAVSVCKGLAAGNSLYAEFEDAFRFTDKGNFRGCFYAREFLIFFDV